MINNIWPTNKRKVGISFFVTLKIVLILLLNFFGFSVKASHQCVDILLVEAKATTAATYLLAEPSLSARIPFIESSLKDVNAMLGPLAPPPKPTISLVRRILSPNAFEESNTMELGVQTVTRLERSGKTKIYAHNPITETAVITHEYGHLVFGENIGRLLPAWKQGRDDWNQDLALLTSETEIGKIIMEQVADLNGKERMRSLMEEISAIQKKREALEDSVDIYRELKKTASPYNEFFADVVAVLSTGNPASVHQSIHFTAATGKKTYKGKVDQPRNFESHPGRTSPALTPHAFFASSRRYLWDYYLSSPTYLTYEREKILNGIFRAIMNQLVPILEGKREMLDSEQANLDLNLEIEKELNKLGLEALK